MLEIIYLLLIGISTGLLSGLFGIGGGIITVPFLLFILQQHPIYFATNTMQIAACTSLTIMALTAASSARAYHQRQTLVWPIFWRIAPGLVLGLLTGTVLSHVLNNQLLITLFAFFLIGIGVHFLYEAHHPSIPPKNKILQGNLYRFSPLQHGFLIVGGVMVGSLSALFGIGGGVLLVPLFLRIRFSMQQAAGTSAICGCVSAFIGAGLLACLPQTVPNLPYLLGNIYWPAVLCIGLTSVLFAPLGTRLAFYLQTAVLKRLFAGILFVSAWCLL